MEMTSKHARRFHPAQAGDVVVVTGQRTKAKIRSSKPSLRHTDQTTRSIAIEPMATNYLNFIK